jgi:hypothetical protein
VRLSFVATFAGCFRSILLAILCHTVPKVRERGEPDYRHKADFGKVPAYLSEIKREIAEEKEFIATVLAEQSATHSGPRVRVFVFVRFLLFFCVLHDP